MFLSYLEVIGKLTGNVDTDRFPIWLIKLYKMDLNTEKMKQLWLRMDWTWIETNWKKLS